MKVPHRYRLTESPTQVHLLLLAHAIASLLLWYHVDPGWMGLTSVTLVGLLAIRDCAAVRRQNGEILSIDEARALISLEGSEQPYFYAKYKVYACRWFAILKLVDQHQPRTLILNFDSVENAQDYRRLRHTLLALEPCRAA